METFKDTNIDGETILMQIDGNVIRFGNRFEERCKMHLGVTTWEKQRDIRRAFDFFRNYATLLSRSELKSGFQCYRRAAEQQQDSTRNAFWRFMDGCRIQVTGKYTFRYDNKLEGATK
jgi:hypothetical protein